MCGYRDITNARIGRIAGVVTRNAPIADPASVIISKFCKQEMASSLFADADSFELHCNKRYNLDDYRVNSWVRCKSRKKEDNQRLLLIEQDINTLNEELKSRNFTNEEVGVFFHLLPKEMNDIFALYF